jgi:hypothetical protein
MDPQLRELRKEKKQRLINILETDRNTYIHSLADDLSPNDCRAVGRNKLFYARERYRALKKEGKLPFL